MIRILHSVSNMDRAGIETMLMNYYRHMDRDKIQFDFLCNKPKPGAYNDEIRAMGGRIFVSPGLNPMKYPKYLKFMKKIFDEHPEYKIVEAHNGALGEYALHAAKVNKIPIRIFHAHGSRIEKDFKMPIKLFCMAALPHDTTHQYSCGISAAKFFFTKKIFEANDYEFIPNAIEVERFVYNQKIRDDIRKKYNLEGKHVMGHVGRFTPVKNQSFLIDIFAEIAAKDADSMLVLLGDGELQEEIEAKVAQKGIKDRVVFVGNVSNANEWYNVFDAFVMTSFCEGFPVVGVEAQANDLPCFFSAGIPSEVGIIDTAKFISLDKSAAVWADLIMEGMKHVRRDNTSVMTDKNYNIKCEAEKLQERYLKLYEVAK